MTQDSQLDSAVIVTGAASGIGLAIAQSLIGDGYLVGLMDMSSDGVAQACSTLGPNCVALCADQSDEHQVQSALDEFFEAIGDTPLCGVVANAGIVRFGPLLDLASNDWTDTVRVNLTGTFLTVRAVARRWIEEGHGGSVVTITSMNGVVAGPNAGAYGATKAAIARLTQQMALEWGQYGIRANSVAPGLIDAGMSTEIYADPGVREVRESRVPLGRLGTSGDVASAVTYLLSDDSSYVTGVELLVDGGITHSAIAGLPRPRSVDTVGDNAGGRVGDSS